VCHVDRLLDRRFDGAVAASESISVSDVESFPCAIASPVVWEGEMGKGKSYNRACAAECDFDLCILSRHQKMRKIIIINTNYVVCNRNIIVL